ncbi:unnamed protein product, partial [marine sediment metagenome]
NTLYYKESDWLINEKISSQPYSIKLYRNNTVNITVYYYDGKDEIAIPDADNYWFTLFSGLDPKNESYSLNNNGNG